VAGDVRAWIPASHGQRTFGAGARGRSRGGRCPKQGRSAAGAGEGGGRSRGGCRRPPEQGRALPEQDNLGNGKIRNIEVLFVKSTCHVSTDSGPLLSEIMLIHLSSTISAYWNKFVQNRWFFAISPNTGCFANFRRKCGGFLELTRDM
jgi:hypothetical protein